MPLYKCLVTKASLFEAVIEVEAKSAEMASFIAEQIAASHEGPWSSLGYEYDCTPSDVDEVGAPAVEERVVGKHPALGEPYSGVSANSDPYKSLADWFKGAR